MIEIPMRLLIFCTAAMGLLRPHFFRAAPLPPRALARIGDHRFYHGPGIMCVALSPDGRRAASYGYYLRPEDIADEDRIASAPAIVLWDTATGERLREMRVSLGLASYLVFSADGKRLAVSHNLGAERAGVILFDVETGKQLWQWDDLQAQISCLQFSADGKQVRVSEWRGRVSAWDAETGKQLHLWHPPPDEQSRKNPARKVSRIGVVSPDGKLIVWDMCGYTREGSPCFWMEVRVQDAATNKLLYQKKFSDPNEESERDEFQWSAFTPDSKRLVADHDKLVVWEAATGRELASLKVAGMVSFVLSPDGTRAAIEESEKRGGKARLRLWNIETGKPLRELFPVFTGLGNHGRRALPVFSADGKTLLVGSDSALHFFDGRTGKERVKPGGHRAPITPRFSADGQTLFTTCAEKRCRWNVSGNGLALLSREKRKASESESLARSTDDRFIVDRSPEGHMRVCESATGRVLHTPPVFAAFAVFSPDAKRVLFYLKNSEEYCNIHLYDVKSGKELDEIEKAAPCGQPAFSPDGRLVAWADQAGDIHLHDSAAKKTVRILRSAPPLLKRDLVLLWFDLLFSPDGEYLIATGEFVDNSDSETWKMIGRPLRVFHLASGREIARFYPNPEKGSRAAGLSCIACSPDGRLLAVAKKHSGTIRLLEIASGKVRAEFAGHRHGVHGLAFSPDGKTLASGGEDHVAFLWDVTGTRTLSAEKPLRRDISDSLWNDLASENGQRAGFAIASLLRKPETSVRFLCEKLHPEEKPTEKRLARLIAELDADAYGQREAASRELILLDRQAEAALRRELTKRPTLEMRRRVEDILAKLEPSSPPQQMLQKLRAVEVLEHVATPEARHCLEYLAKGAADARLTREAKSASRRLANRGPEKR